MPDLTLEKLQLFLVVVFPGVIGLKVHDLLSPPEKRDFGGSLLEAITFGVVNLAVWCWLLILINIDDYPKQHPIRYALLSFVPLVISPAGMAVLYHYLRGQEWLCRRIGYPTRKAWDDFFNRDPCCYLLVHLKNGKKIGGYYGGESYVSSYPDEPDLYLEQAWRVDEHGRLEGKVEGTLGFYVKQEDCELIEFIKEDPNGEAK
jgi:Family of unknown function (DUF6338)